MFEIFSEHAPIVLNFFRSVNPFSCAFFSGLIKLFRKIGVDKTESAEADLTLSELTIDALLGMVSQAGFSKPNIVIENWPLNDEQKSEIRNLLSKNNLSTDIENSMQALIIREFKLKVYR